MNPIEFRAFLDLLMCSDPWPVRDNKNVATGDIAMTNYADQVAAEYGFTNWIDAYHRHRVQVTEEK